MTKNKKTLFLLCAFAVAFSSAVHAQKIKVTYTSAVFEGPFTGRVILYLSKDGKTPKDLDYGLPLFCCFSITVKDVKPNTEVVFDDAATSYPVKLSDIERGEYYAQAVWDRNTGGRSIGNSADNMYNNPSKISLTKNVKETFSITCSDVIPKPEFKETDFVKELRVPSPLLTAFYKRTTTVDAAVILPKEYATDSARKFPVLYLVSGYGGNYHNLSGRTRESTPMDSIPCITVFLDGNCQTGHSTYANSANNGPWGDALVNEFIPAFEKKYRCDGARFLNGHSSGGWSVVWLQVNYPKTFAGCWSSAPDPLDFRNFQMVNIYDDRNMYYDKDTTLRIDWAVAGYFPVTYLRDDYRIENILYRGEQYWSWNAVFGKKAKDGMPESICNVNTGEIDSLVANHWKDYDISLLVRNHWEELKPVLDGKIRVTAGNHDSFFLDKSVKLFEEEMKKLNTKFEFAYYPGDHFTVWTADYGKDGNRFMAKKYAEWLSQNANKK